MVREESIALPTLPQSTSATLAYLESSASGTLPQGPLGYLHKVRSITGRYVDAIASSNYSCAYYDLLSTYVKSYRMWAQSRAFDLIVRPPSHRHDSEPYAAAVRAACNGASDLSGRFAKVASVRAGNLSSVTELIQHMRCTATRDEVDTCQRIVIIDDVFSKGLSAAAVLQLLYDVGLPANAAVTVCAPLWMKQS